MARHVLRIAALAGAATVALVTAMSVAAPALAHNYYIDSTPGIDEVLTTLPDEFVVTTNDNLLDMDGAVGGFFMQVQGPDGLYYGDGCVSVRGPSVTMPAALGPPGDYTLAWQVISADGHTVSDTIPFTWQPAEGQESSAQGSSVAPNCGEEPLATSSNNSAESAAGEVSTDVLWIGGAIVAVALALVVTLLLLRPKKKE